MEIRFSKTAAKALLRSDKRRLIREKIDELAQNPDAMKTNVIKLQGLPEFRLRVQDWRIIFRIEENILWIDDIGPRGSIYQE
jgi:mRNA interferase RelE/StbE